MDIIGDYRCVQVMTYTENGFQYKDAEEVIKEDPSMGKAAMTVFRFEEGGKIRFLFPISEDMMEQAKEEGLEIIEGRYAVVDEPKEWKEVDGKIMYDTGTNGTVLGEKVDPWAELKMDEDGLYEFMGFYKIRKI